MQDKIISIERSNAKNKKYKAIVLNKNTKRKRTINFGDKRYEQYKDSTPLKLYNHKNHTDNKRRTNYFSRHSGVKSKAEALKKEKIKSNYKFNAKILSHKYLW